MLSILIPIYNYDASILITEVNRQCMDASLEYEIICLEDGSTSEFVQLNEKVKEAKNVKYIVQSKNCGRIEARKQLANLAKYQWLIFLDADIEIKSASFIRKYVKATQLDYDAVFGGFTYEEEPPAEEFMLRWKYGKNHEQIDAAKRNNKPYKVIISANYLVKKEVFQKIYGKINFEGYGYDNYFGSLLKKEGVKVFHINNEAIHRGIEKSEVYLRKKEKAAETLVNLYNSGRMTEHENDLLKLFLHIKNYRLITAISKFFQLNKNWLKRNLLGNNPLIPLLQLYRISYMCNYYKQIYQAK